MNLISTLIKIGGAILTGSIQKEFALIMNTTIKNPGIGSILSNLIGGRVVKSVALLGKVSVKGVLLSVTNTRGPALAVPIERRLARERTFASGRRARRSLSIFFGLCFCALGISAQAATLTWESLGIPDEDAIPTGTMMSASGVTMTTTWALLNVTGFPPAVAPAFGNDYVSYESGTLGNHPGFASMAFDHIRFDPRDRLVLTLTFSQPVTGLSFSLLDVDQLTWDDAVEIFADGVNLQSNPAVTLGGAGVAVDNEPFMTGYEGVSSVASSSIAGNVILNFGATPVTVFRIEYFSGVDDIFSLFNPAAQNIGISDVTFDDPPTAADLSVEKSLTTAAPYTAGDTITYDIVVTNNGPNDASNVMVSDTPTGITITALAGAGTCTSTAPVTLPCNLGTIANGASETVTVTATIDSIATSPGTFTNATTVSADETDPNSANNTSSVSDQACAMGEFQNRSEVSTSTSIDPDPSNNGSIACAVITATPGNIMGTVWLEQDGDGYQDIGEPGIQGVTVYLCDSAASPCDSGSALATAVTDANGDYNFPGLDAGDYQTQVEPNELTAGNELENLDEAPGNSLGNSGTITLPAGGTEEADFGYVPDAGTGAVEGSVWSDADGDGVQDPGEPGIEGVTVFICAATVPQDECNASFPANIETTAVTGPDGSYIATNLPEGEFYARVDTTDPELTSFCSGLTVDNPADDAGDCDTVPTVSTPFTIIPDKTVQDIDFGFNNPTQTSTISDRIWYDNDGGADYEPNGDDGNPATVADNEMGLGGVTVDLIDCGAGTCSDGDETVIASTVTNPDGTFSFPGVPSTGTEDYQVQVTDNNGVLNPLSETTSTGGTIDITDLSGDVDNTATPSFGYNQPGSVSGSVYSDSAGDGVNDPSDAGISGVTVELQDGVCTTGVDCPTTTTNPDGSYEFTGVPPGNYTVVVNPDGSGDGTAPQGTQTGDPDTTLDSETTVTVVAGQSETGLDFGYQDTSLDTISGNVFNDKDKDGVREPNGNDGMPGTTDDNDTGFGGVTVELRDTSGNVVATTTTAPDGSYSFPDVPDGNYVVTVTDVDNVLDGYELTSGLDEVPVTADSGTAGDPDPIDFGYGDDTQTGAITSGLWLDENGDGIRDTGETGISGVDIELTDCGLDIDGDGDPCGDSDDTVIATVTTDADGNVIFDELPPGNYMLNAVETDPDFPSGITEIGTYGGNDPNDPISLSEGEVYDADFGYEPDTGEAMVSGTVWSDVDGDGVLDPGEAGIGGVTLELYDYGPDGFPGNADDGCTPGVDCPTVVTAPDGSYEFTGLVPDHPSATSSRYEIYYDDTTIPGPYDETQPTNMPPGDTSWIVGPLMAGDIVTDLDFGFDGPGGTNPGTGDISGTFYIDTDQNSDRDADGADNTLNTADDEPGIEFVTLNLVDNLGNVVATTTTDENGAYSFTGVQPGDYNIVPTDQALALQGLNPTEVPTLPITVTSGSSATDVDFGYSVGTDLGSIGNLVWFDFVDDGLWDEDGADDVLGTGDDEVGIANVTIECWHDVDNNDLLEPGTDNLIRTRTTDENGNYYCESVPTSDYLVRIIDKVNDTGSESPLAEYAEATAGPDQSDTADANNKLRPYPLATASNNFTADFGFVPANPGTISGSVYDDNGDGGGTANNGTRDGTEPAVPSMPVNLYTVDASGNRTLLLTTTTLPDGSYSFINLPAGNYVVEIDTSGTSFSGHTQTQTPGPIALNGGTSANNDFGLYQAPVTNPVTLSFFEARPGPNEGDVQILWRTSTETGNLGFNLYVKHEGDWEKLNSELILSTVINSVETQEYSVQAVGANGDTFALSDVDIFGNEILHGPFKLGEQYGNENRARETDWQAIRDAHEQKAQQRKQRQQQHMRQKLEHQLQPEMDSEEKLMRQRFKQLRQSSGAGVGGDDMSFNTVRKSSPHHSQSQSSRGVFNRVAVSLLSAFVGTAHAASSDDLMLVNVETPGIYRVSYEDLVAAGLDLAGVRRNKIVITNQGEQIEAAVTGSNVGKNGEKPWSKRAKNYFGPGSTIEFYAEGIDDSLYTQENVYVLGANSDGGVNRNPWSNNLNRASAAEGSAVSRNPWGGGVSRPQAVPSGDPEPYYLETVTMAPNLNYSFTSPINDPWYWTFLYGPFSGGPQVEISDLYPGGTGSKLTVQVYGGTDLPENPDHHFTTEIGGVTVIDELFDGITALENNGEGGFEVDISTALLQEGQNSVTLGLPHDLGAAFELIYVESISITYPRRFVARDDVLTFSAQGAVFEVENFSSDNIHVHQVDENGGSTPVEATVSAYTDGGGAQKYKARFAGNSSAQAKYTVAAESAIQQANLTPAPVLEDITTGQAQYLVISHGDFIGGSLDLLTNHRSGQFESIKVVDVEQIYSQFGDYILDAQAIKDYVAHAYSNMGTQYVLIIGGDTYDPFAHLNYPGGAAPVSFVPSLYVQTDSIVRYAPSDPKYADVDGDDIPDVAIGRIPARTEQELATIVDKILQYEQKSYVQTAVFAADEYDLPNQYDFSQDADELIADLPANWQANSAKAYVDTLGIAGARTALLNEINAGVALTSFVGHSGPNSWSFSGLFSGADAAALTNHDEPTVVTQWGCWNSYYTSPTEDTLGHEWLLNGSNGAAAVMGATTLTTASGEVELGKRMLPLIAQPDQLLGDAILQAKQSLSEDFPDRLDMLLGWTLLGDPGMAVD